jgi:hypothetical protein
MTEVFNKNTFAVTYRDDFAESDGYYRILFNNGRLLQARELNQLQTIIQTEIKRFANNIFKEGAAVNPGGVTVNNRYQFIKLAAATSLPSNLSLLVDRVFTGQTSGVQFRVIEAVNADTSDTSDTGNDPPTLFVTYTNTLSGTAGATSVTVDAGETITDGVYTYTVQATNTVANPAVGFGTRVSVGAGSFYALGHFVFVEAQSKIVQKYNGAATATVGFIPTQDIVTVDDTEALYDNSNDTPNITAPGADRYRILLNLALNFEVGTDDQFIYVARIVDGQIAHEASGLDDYNKINDLLALRTKEESGNYVAEEFTLAANINDSDESKIDLQLSRGVAYINGYRASVNYPTVFTVNKARDTLEVENQAIPATYGNFIKSNGGKGLRDVDVLEQVNLNDDSSYGGSVIGTARVRAFDNETTLVNGVRYYLFDIQMNSNQNFRDVKSFGQNDSDYANILQENGVSVLYETGNNTSLFSLPRTRPQSINDISYTAQRRFTASTDGTGQATINLTATGETFANTTDWIFANEDSDVITGLSVSGVGTQAATISGGPASSSNFEIYAYVNKANASSKVKTLTETTVTSTVESDGDGTIFLDLGRADIYDVSRIRQTDSDGADFSNRFVLDNGQRDNFYALGKLILRDGYPEPAGNVFARFRYFAHSTSGDFFSVNSYSGQVDFGDIPAHRLNNGNIVSLADVLDFRPIQDANGAYSGANARVMELPEPQTSVTSDVIYYLPRTDVLSISEDANVEILTGKSSFDPLTPDVPTTNLALFEIDYNPYTFNDEDVIIDRIPNKGYTMAEIAALEQRIADVEEAVTLSLLELDVANLEVLDSNGNNRLKSGFVADNFEDFRLTDLDTPEGRSGIDVQRKELGPEVNINAVRLVYDSDESSNTILKGDNVYMKYDEILFTSQPSASGVQVINPFDVYKLVGRLILSPSVDNWVEVRQLADIILTKTVRRTVTNSVTRYRNVTRTVSGGGGGGGGGKVICGELHRQGLIPTDIYMADLKYHRKYAKPEEVIAYHAWAVPYARLMKRSKIATYAILPFSRAWAYEMAYRMGSHDKSNFVGRVITNILPRLHGFVGKFMLRSQKV